jgi:type I restriction enzyme S subunit
MVVKKGYRQTELGFIPEDWMVVEFKLVSTMKGRIGWQGLKQTEFTDNQEDPFLITGMNFKDGEIKWKEVYHVSEDRYSLAKEIQLKTGDVLMTKDGTIGKLLFVEDIPYPNKATLNSHLLVFRPINGSYVPKYLYYNLSSSYFLKHIELYKSGTTFFGISQESVGKYTLILPPLSEQADIAEALSDMDALIAQTEKLIEKKKAIKQGVMQELLKPKEGWVKRRLGEFCAFFSGGTPATSNSSFYGGAIKWITSSDLNKTGIEDVEGRITKAGLINSSAKMVKKGTLLVALYGATAGVTAITNIDAAINQAVLAIVPKDDNTRFLFYCLSNLKNWIVSTYLQGGQGNLSGNIFKELELQLPSRKDQDIIATILFDLDCEISKLESKLRKLHFQRQGMMQSLLTGKIRLI